MKIQNAKLLFEYGRLFQCILCSALRKTLIFVDLSPHRQFKTKVSAAESLFDVNKIRAFAHYAFVRNDSDINEREEGNIMAKAKKKAVAKRKPARKLVSKKRPAKRAVKRRR